MTEDLVQLTAKDWAGLRPTWCPGCGDFGVLKATKDGLVDLKWLPKNTVVVSGIGCSSNFPHFVGGYGIHTIHGRANPVAEGIKLANPDLNVVVAGGDGDGLAIGIGGFLHAARRNFDLTYLIMDNQVYGLTVNQVSPTSGLDRKTRSTPYGNIEPPLNPIALAIAAGATFVARTFSKEGEHFQRTVAAAMQHKGFSFIDALSPCVTFNKVNTYDYWKEHVYKLEDDPSYDKTDINQALVRSQEWGETGGKVPIGIFYQTDKPTYEDLDFTNRIHHNVVKRGPQKITEDYKAKIIKEFS